MLDLHDIHDSSWKDIFSAFCLTPAYFRLQDFLTAQGVEKKRIFPEKNNVFKALNETFFEDVKVVILGQDPYHGFGQAHGLAFSVPKGIKPPPSLKNIYREIERDLKIPAPHQGDLTPWAQQGVLLLNATLTVEEAKAGSHQKKGWEELTDNFIEALNMRKRNIVFMLWGAYAQKKGCFIDQSKHLVLQSVHPSPLSAHRGFIGCGHFSKANEYLRKTGKTPINWSL